MDTVMDLIQVAVQQPGPIFSEVDLSIGLRDRIGVVGRNGVGKSLLLSCICGQCEIMSGRIHTKKGTRIGLASQSDTDGGGGSVALRDFVVAGIPEEERHYEAWRGDVFLDHFRASSALCDTQFDALSGGWRQIAQLGRGLLSDADVLCLDEPTNHLDLERIILLEEWIDQNLGDKAVVVVSHDRRFLDNITRKTVFLRPSDSSAVFNYPFSRARELLGEQLKAQALEAKKTAKEVRRLQASAHDLRQIGVNNYSGAALRKSVQIARRAERLENSVRPALAQTKGKIQLRGAATHQKKLLEFNDASISTPDGRHLFSTGDFNLLRGDRLAVIGENGTGKSRLIATLLERIETPVSNVRQEDIVVSSSVNAGYMDQHASQLPSGIGLLEFAKSFIVGTHGEVVSRLVRFGFTSEAIDAPLEMLSSGQRSRVSLFILESLRPNLYLLDEPTNFLDFDSQDQLIEALEADEATAVIVSHDRSFLERVATRYLLVKEGRAKLIEDPS